MATRAGIAARLLAAVVVPALCAGCAPGVSTSGPLGKSAPAVDAEQCSPLPPSGRLILGDDAVENKSNWPVSVDAVDLVGASGVTELAAYLVPWGSQGLLGDRPGVPPTGLTGAESALWAGRRTVPAVLAPGVGVNLVVAVQAVEGTDTVDHLVVRYHVSRHAFRLAMGLRYRLESTSC